MDVIFLNDRYRDLLREMKYSLDVFRADMRESYFSQVDLRNIRQAVDDTPYSKIISCMKLGSLISVEPSYGYPSNVAKELSPTATGTPLHAYCPDPDTIVLWVPTEEELEAEKQRVSCGVVSNNMLGGSLVQVLRALERVMPLGSILKTVQFELAVSNNRCNR